MQAGVPDYPAILCSGAVMPQFMIQLTDDEFRTVHILASKRRTKPNAVMQQALATEKLLADNMGPEDELLIKKRNGEMQKVIFLATPAA